MRASVEVHMCNFAANAVEDREDQVIVANGDNEAHRIHKEVDR